MSDDTVIEVIPLGFPWVTIDPFLFCVHHDDGYPRGNAAMGPDASLEGRKLGMDFDGIDGWSMYHGDVVPGFPRHPHRGFETVTVARRGLIDHSDSLGAKARFGDGDCQWMTAGKGVVHSEMFPLVRRDADNPLELFQIWLNLPRTDKMVDPYFTMFWGDTIPRHTFTDEDGRETEVAMLAGALGEDSPPPPPPNSWASRPDSDVAIWTMRLSPGATWTVPPAKSGTNRMLYFFRGASLEVAGTDVPLTHGARVRGDAEARLQNGDEEAEVLMLQGRPIGDPVVHYGSFVMNEQAEIQQAMNDYRRTGFGGWPWESDGPTHAREEGRFAVHADGHREEPQEVPE